MRRFLRETVGSVVVAMGLLVSTAVDSGRPTHAALVPRHGVDVQRNIPKEARTGARPFVRTELFFGTVRPGGTVTREEFRTFVDRQVRPRFPDGLTLLEADGQFQAEDNVIMEERSFVLILLYPYENFEKTSERIERIRHLYKEQFNQESVLRVDASNTVWVSF